jgi:hypothetical protein
VKRLLNAPDSRRFSQKDGQSAVSSVQLENGECAKTGNETVEQLLQVHFPGSKIILEPSGGWDGLEGVSDMECI